MKLLIVDDNPAIRGLIRSCLELLTTDVRESASGEEAVRQCATFVPDCITVDLRMPGIDGLTTITRVRKLHPHAYIVLVTQFDHSGIEGLALRAGADALVLKERISGLAAVLQCGVRRTS
ncbi:MAG: response regulator [Steroidobacteraceae bacterium]